MRKSRVTTGDGKCRKSLHDLEIQITIDCIGTACCFHIWRSSLTRVRETPPSDFPSEQGAHEAYLTAWCYKRDPAYINAPSNRVEFEIRLDKLRAIVCRGEYVHSVYFILIGPYS